LREERKAFPVMAHLSKSDAQVEGQDRPARLVARPVKDGSSFAEYGLRFRRFAFPEERQAQLDQRVTFFDRMTCLSVHLTGLEQARSAPAMQAQSLKDRSLATPEVTEHGEGSAALPRTEKNPGPAEMGDRPDELACLHQSFARMPEADSPFIPAAGSKGHTRCSAQVQRGVSRTSHRRPGARTQPLTLAEIGAYLARCGRRIPPGPYGLSRRESGRALSTRVLVDTRCSTLGPERPVDEGLRSST